MKKLIRLTLPLALAGTAVFGGASAAHAGSWIDSGYLYNTLGTCRANGPAVMAHYGGSAWACDIDAKSGKYEVRVYID